MRSESRKTRPNILRDNDDNGFVNDNAWPNKISLKLKQKALNKFAKSTSIDSLRHDVCSVCNCWKYASNMTKLKIGDIPNSSMLTPHGDILKTIRGYMDERVPLMKITTGVFITNHL